MEGGVIGGQFLGDAVADLDRDRGPRGVAVGDLPEVGVGFDGEHAGDCGW